MTTKGRSLAYELRVRSASHLAQPRVRRVRGLQNNPFPRPTLRGGLLSTLLCDPLRAMSQELVNDTLGEAGHDKPQARGFRRAPRDRGHTELGHDEAWDFSLEKRN